MVPTRSSRSRPRSTSSSSAVSSAARLPSSGNSDQAISSASSRTVRTPSTSDSSSVSRGVSDTGLRPGTCRVAPASRCAANSRGTSHGRSAGSIDSARATESIAQVSKYTVRLTRNRSSTSIASGGPSSVQRAQPTGPTKPMVSFFML